MNLKSFFLIVLVISSTVMFAQNVGINNTGAVPNNNAILDVDVSTNNKGILIPRVTSGQRTGIGGLAAADEGLTVYDETTNSYWLWDGTQWVQFLMEGNAWSLAGNAGTTPGTDFIGTTDAQDWVIKTNNTEKIRVYSGGDVDFNNNTMYLRDNPGNTYGIGYNVEGGSEMSIFSDNLIEFTESDADVVAVHISTNTRRLGINTNAPSTTLDVNGTVRIRGGAPTVGDLLMCNNANGTATWAAAGYGMVPIGTIVAWHKNAAGVPALPAGWVECNGGTSNGIVVPNLNGATTSKSGDASIGRFLRGNTTSGLFQTDQSNNLRWVNHDDSGNGDTNDFLDDDGTTFTIRNYSTNGDRYQGYLEGVETRVTNMSVVWIMRTQ